MTTTPASRSANIAIMSRAVLGIVAGFAFLFGIGSALLGTSAVHQILTAVYFLIFTVALAGLMVAETIRAAFR